MAFSMNADTVYSDFKNAMQQARDANLQRYSDVLSGYDSLMSGYQSRGNSVLSGYNDLLKRQAQVGDSQRIALQQQYGQQLGNAKASLYARGLGNSTVTDAVSRGINRDLATSQIGLQDALSREYASVDLAKLGYKGQLNQGLTGLGTDRLNFMERRTDAYPNLGSYAQLAQMTGLGAGGFPVQGGFTAGGFGVGQRGAGGVSAGGGMTMSYPVSQPMVSTSLSSTGQLPANGYGSSAGNIQVVTDFGNAGSGGDGTAADIASIMGSIAGEGGGGYGAMAGAMAGSAAGNYGFRTDPASMNPYAPYGTPGYYYNPYSAPAVSEE